MEKLFEDDVVNSADIAVSLRTDNGAYLKSTIRVERGESDVRPLEFDFSPGDATEVDLLIISHWNIRTVLDSMDLLKLTAGKRLPLTF
ncbi:MAG: hypothetical protein MI807_16275 [Verrucomicrobiales bacterium]|nr:hypothetical protein [Verrucomicrobiales bacterium]